MGLYLRENWMKILHFNHDAMIGGAGIAAYRQHQGLLHQGMDSRLLVGRVKSDSDRVAVASRKPRIEGRLLRFIGS